MKNSQSLITLAITGLATVMLAACSASVDGGTIDLPPLPQNVFNISTANGIWKSTCFTNNVGPTETTILTLADGAFKKRKLTYKNSDCSDSNILEDQTMTGNYSIRGESSAERGSYEIDIKIIGEGFSLELQDLILVNRNEIYLGDYLASPNGDYPSKVDQTNPYVKQ